MTRHAQNRRKHPLPTARQLCRKFAYLPHTGEIMTKRGVVGSKTPGGIIVCYKQEIRLYAHHVAFMLMKGRWPKRVKHINGDIYDNRWINLEKGSYAGKKYSDRVNKPPAEHITRHSTKDLYMICRGEKRFLFTLWRDAYQFEETIRRGMLKHGPDFIPPIPPQEERIKPLMRFKGGKR